MSSRREHAPGLRNGGDPRSAARLARGRLVRLLKDEGDTVRQGDTLAVLEQPGLDALISQRRAQAKAAGLRTAEVAAAQADSARAANDLARAEPLRRQNIVSQQQYEALKAAATAAAARLAAMRAAPSESVAAGAALAVTLSTRDQLTVLARDDGVILTRYTEPGEVIAAGTPVASLGLVHRPWIRAYVGERFIARLKVGQPATIRVDGYPDRPFAGRVAEIASQAEFTPRAATSCSGSRWSRTAGTRAGASRRGCPSRSSSPSCRDAGCGRDPQPHPA